MKNTLRYIWLQLLLVCFTSGALYAQTTNDKIGALGGVIDVSSTGAAQYAIPIDCPSGLNGMQPSLSITYNSQGGDGFLGMGWDISGLSAIFRGSVNISGELQGIDFSSSDGYHLDGNRLIEVTPSESKVANIHKTEVETFHLIEGLGSIQEYYSNSTGSEWFRVSTKDGKTMEYGHGSEYRFVPDEDLGKKAPYMWLLNSVYDRNGNYIKYEYTKTRNRPYLSKITYGNDFTSDVTEIKFSHAQRLSGEHLSYIAGRKVYNDNYCSEIKVERSGQVLHTFAFKYTIEEATGIPFLTSIEKKYSDEYTVSPNSY